MVERNKKKPEATKIHEEVTNIGAIDKAVSTKFIIDMAQFENSEFQREMEKAINGDKRNENIFKRMGMFGRCLHNLLLMGTIKTPKALALIKLMNMNDLKGVNSANLRKVVRESRSRSTGKRKASLAYLPVFWMQPIDEYKKTFMQVQSELESLRRKLDRKRVTDTLMLIDGNTDKLEKPVKSKPIDMMHERMKDLDRMCAANRHDFRIFLPATKMQADVATLLLRFDTDIDEDEIDENKILDQFDKLVQFMFNIADEYPDLGIEKRFKNFMETEI